MTPSKPVKPKVCRHCKALFLPARPLQVACSPNCALSLARIKGAKASALILKWQRKERKAALNSLLTLRDWIKATQTTFNKFIRLRDGKQCISCGTTNPNIQYAAGHFRSTAAAPELRFSELNVWVQCNFQCNQQLSGNLIPYRVALIAKIGQANVDYLEGKHPPAKYTIADCQALIALYKTKIKAISCLGLPVA